MGREKQYLIKTKETIEKNYRTKKIFLVVLPIVYDFCFVVMDFVNFFHYDINHKVMHILIFMVYSIVIVIFLVFQVNENLFVTQINHSFS